MTRTFGHGVIFMGIDEVQSLFYLQASDKFQIHNLFNTLALYKGRKPIGRKFKIRSE